MNEIQNNWKKNYRRVFLLGLLVSFLFFLPYLTADHGMFLYYGDFNVQQIPFYSLCHDAIRQGNVYWNWNTDLGANFIGSYTFYLLGSPFFWITELFPNGAVPYLMAPLLMLKFALTGMTAYAYIGRFVKKADTAMLGGLLYAFSGFNLYNIFFNHFNEVVMAFPLLLIAMEEFIVNKRRGVFAVTVAFCALMNYYFFFGEVLFCILYFFIRRTGEDFKVTAKEFGLLFLEAVLGVLLAGILLLPSFFAVIQNPRTDETLTGFDLLFYGNPQRYGLILSSFFFPPDIPARPNFFPDSNAKWSSVSMFLPLLSTTGVFAFFFGEKKHWAKRLLLICFAACFIPALNALPSLLNYSYYARWFFMPLLIMAMVSCVAIEEHFDQFKKSIRWTAVLVGIFALIGILPESQDGKLVWFHLVEFPERFWVYVGIAIAGLLCTHYLVKLTPRHPLFYRSALCFVCVLTVATGGFMIFTGKITSGADYYNQVVNEALYGRKKLTLKQQGFYRIDTYDEMDNLSMYWRLPTINAFHSIVPGSIMDYYSLIGEERGVASRPKPEVTGVRGLLSVKYRFVSDRQKNITTPAGFSIYGHQNGFTIYQNDHFVPMGFTYDYFLTKKQMDECLDGYKDRLLLKGLYLSDSDRAKYKDILPVLPESETLETQMNDLLYFKDCDNRAKNAVTDFSYNSKGFTAKADLQKKNLVFFSVPYESGWNATVNGRKAEILKADGGFMAVLAPQGVSTIRFSYHTPGIKGGVLITILGILLLFGYLLIVRHSRRKSQETYRPYQHRYHEKFLPAISAKTAYLSSFTKDKKTDDSQ